MDTFNAGFVAGIIVGPAVLMLFFTYVPPSKEMQIEDLRRDVEIKKLKAELGLKE